MGLRLWLRRCTAFLCLPALVAVAVIVLFSRTGWQWELDRAMSWASSSVIILAPIMAGLVSFDLWKKRTSTLRQLDECTLRGWRTVTLIVVATWLWGCLAWLVGLLLALGWAMASGASWVASFWILLECPLALLAAAALGGLIGVALHRLVAAPLSAIVCYAIPLLAMRFNTKDFMTAGGATASLAGIEPNPTIVVFGLIANLAFAFACVIVSIRRKSMAWPAKAIVVTAVSCLCLASLATYTARNPQLNYFQIRDSPTRCTGSHPRICVPEESSAFLRFVPEDMHTAATKLREKGIVVTGTYQQRVGNRDLQDGAAELYLAAENFQHGHMTSWDLANNLSVPTDCPAYMADEPPMELLDGQGRLADWMDAVLQDKRTSPQSDAAALTTFKALQVCAPTEIPPWPTS